MNRKSYILYYKIISPNLKILYKTKKNKKILEFCRLIRAKKSHISRVINSYNI